MADAKSTLAPSKQKELQLKEEKYQKEKEYLEMEFDANRKYVFQLAVENLERELPVIGMVGQRHMAEPHKRFKPYQNIVLTSQITWEGKRRIIRYYDGCTTIFADEQPKDKETIELSIKQTKPRNFLEGKFGCYGDESMLLLYMNICSWNANSPFRTKNADPIFVPIDTDSRASAEIKILDRMDEALKLAKEASEEKMMIHANFLQIEMFDFDTDSEKSKEEIRALYRRKAIDNPDRFITSYGNKAIETNYYIEKALQNNVLSTKADPNKVVWGHNSSFVCDIAGLKSHEAITQRLFEFSQLPEGEEFLIQLTALYKK
jgi:hypothetical protein